MIPLYTFLAGAWTAVLWFFTLGVARHLFGVFPRERAGELRDGVAERREIDARTRGEARVSLRCNALNVTRTLRMQHAFGSCAAREKSTKRAS